MLSILDHRWGLSAAQDRVWAQVSGLAPSKAGKRLFMVLQAFIDESIDEGATFVLGGCISTAESWAAFSGEWEELLPGFGVLDSNGRYSFKMKEMAALQERMDRVVAFYRVIEKHVLGLVSVKINIAELERAKSRIFVPNAIIEWDKFHPYMVAYRYLLDKFHIERPKMTQAIPLNEKIDFYFDERAEKKVIISTWDDYVSKRPDAVRDFYGATPRFEDDNDFLPLQAADFWVWWVRKWYAEGTPEKIMKRDFGEFQHMGIPGKGTLIVNMAVGEDDMVGNFVRMIRDRVGPERPIIVQP
jgi:hypothetical protein